MSKKNGNHIVEVGVVDVPVTPAMEKSCVVVAVARIVIIVIPIEVAMTRMHVTVWTSIRNLGNEAGDEMTMITTTTTTKVEKTIVENESVGPRKTSWIVIVGAAVEARSEGKDEEKIVPSFHGSWMILIRVVTMRKIVVVMKIIIIDLNRVVGDEPVEIPPAQNIGAANAVKEVAKKNATKIVTSHVGAVHAVVIDDRHRQ
jgi:hypothetical protein